MDIKDRIVVITGAAGGIGRALAVACADAGARAVGEDRPVHHARARPVCR